MKKILGLDLGTTSIGWALVNEAETSEEHSSIIKLGVRVNPLTTGKDGELAQFSSGKAVSTNVGRREKRSMRRNLQRYKLRREALKAELIRCGFITEKTILSEQGNFSTFETWRLRAKAADEEISLEEFARVLLMLNKKRGYKSNQKLDISEGEAIDSMDVTEQLYQENITPGEYVYKEFLCGSKHVPAFYNSDLKTEFNKVWNLQATFYPTILTESLKQELEGKNGNQTWAICKSHFDISGIKSAFKGFEEKLERYRYRSGATSKMIDLEHLANVFKDINSDILSSESYLGIISDRSKELHFNKITVGQYKYDQLQKDPNYSLKNQVFYRRDYLDEFDRIWTVQSQYHKELTQELKGKIGSIIIFYQRPLKSQKGLISLCEFEKKEILVDGKKKMIGPRVCPKSSPVFQEFKVRQAINNVLIDGQALSKEQRESLFKELSFKEKMTGLEIVSLFFKDAKNHKINFDSISGNTTNIKFYKAYSSYFEQETGNSLNLKSKAEVINSTISKFFEDKGISTEVLSQDIYSEDYQTRPSYKLWHLIYSYEGDNSISGKDTLRDNITSSFGFPEGLAKIISSICFTDDYGSLSTKAMRKILPFMKEGMEYSEACSMAGYRHSAQSLTREELDNKKYLAALERIQKNSLRNPVVEKILNQMVNVVNAVIDEYGKPDEVRIELARELKKSQKERAEMTKSIRDADNQNREIREILKTQFGKANPSQNDIIRYKLYLELKGNASKTLYTGTYIPQEELFSKKFDIEHIIPQAKRFDDSFGNKTIELRSANIEKADDTAIDYILKKYGEKAAEEFKAKVEEMFKSNEISKTKMKNLLTKGEDIPEGFIERDLRNSQYIAKKAVEMLKTIVPIVVPTTGSVTARLREDWQLVDVMRELNWDKFNAIGKTHYDIDPDGRTIGKIDGWTKRNDHRHHAMDALTIAFCKQAYIQYLNNLNARTPQFNEVNMQLADYELMDVPKAERSRVVMAIEHKYLDRSNGKLRFIPPIPLDSFRAEALKQLNAILVSQKAKNKVATLNVNVTKVKNGLNKKLQLTPRGQLHKETVYGKICQKTIVEVKVDKSFDANMIATVANASHREALLARLVENGNNPIKAFTGKNALDKKPIYIGSSLNEAVPLRVKVIKSEDVFTIRKVINPELSIDKVIDPHVRSILLARLEEYGNDKTKAFSNLDEHPIWLNREKGISIKKVTISGATSVEALHYKRDKDGKLILIDGKPVRSDFVSTGNNHHVAIFEDENGDYQEYITSLFEATQRKSNGLPVVDRELHRDLGWKFLFTMKQNEYFVFPNEEIGFNPADIDLMDPSNFTSISPNLYRVQKFSTLDYVFRHHLESTIDIGIKNMTFKRIQNPNQLKGIVKVRVNHLGKIVQVGEY